MLADLRRRIPVNGRVLGEIDRCGHHLYFQQRVVELGKEVDFNLYMGEGHVFLKTENVVDAEVHRINFLAKALE